jgi:hypothetical protein
LALQAVIGLRHDLNQENGVFFVIVIAHSFTVSSFLHNFAADFVYGLRFL